MTSTRPPDRTPTGPSRQHVTARTDAHFAAFEVLHVDDVSTAEALVPAIASEIDAWTSAKPGLLQSGVYVSLDRSAVVHHTRWTEESRYRSLFPHAEDAGVLDELSQWQGVSRSVCCGDAVGGIEGPASGRRPGIVAVATRHFTGVESARAVVELLHRTGEWKRTFPGFISATAYLSADGTTFVNNPMWLDRSAYDAWMADPRIAEGQAEIACLEVTPPEYLVCTAVARNRRRSPRPGTATPTTEGEA